MRNLQIRRILLSFFAFVAAATMMLSCHSKQDDSSEISLAGTRWEATEHDDLRGGTINTAIEFSSDSTGHFYLVSFDIGDGLVERNDDYPFTYTYDVETQKGKIRLKDDENIYPFSLNDTALLYPSVLNWKPFPYKQVKK